MPEEATSECVARVKEAYPTMNGFRRVEAEGGLTVTGSLELLRATSQRTARKSGPFPSIAYNLKP